MADGGSASKGLNAPSSGMPPGPPCGCEQPRCCESTALWKLNGGPPGTPIRGCAVYGGVVVVPTLVGASTAYRHCIPDEGGEKASWALQQCSTHLRCRVLRRQAYSRRQPAGQPLCDGGCTWPDSSSSTWTWCSGPHRLLRLQLSGYGEGHSTS